MAWKCRCGRRVSDTTDKCPYCGNTLGEFSYVIGVLTIVGVWIAVFFALRWALPLLPEISPWYYPLGAVLLLFFITKIFSAFGPTRKLMFKDDAPGFVPVLVATLLSGIQALGIALCMYGNYWIFRFLLKITPGFWAAVGIHAFLLTIIVPVLIVIFSNDE